jgi:hypothetical protein
MINSNAIDIFYEKQHKLVLTAIELKCIAKELLIDLECFYPEIFKSDISIRLNKICDKWNNIISTDGDCNE